MARQNKSARKLFCFTKNYSPENTEYPRILFNFFNLISDPKRTEEETTDFKTLPSKNTTPCHLALTEEETTDFYTLPSKETPTLLVLKLISETNHLNTRAQ